MARPAYSLDAEVGSRCRTALRRLDLQEADVLRALLLDRHEIEHAEADEVQTSRHGPYRRRRESPAAYSVRCLGALNVGGGEGLLKPFDYPAQVVHALDYFIWAALDEAVAPPLESRPFSDDERHYNAILNRYFGSDVPSTAEASMPRMPPGPGGRLVPNYFPDGEINTTGAIAKHARVMNQFEYRQSRLNSAAEAAYDTERVGASMPTSRWALLNTDAYTGYFRLNLEEGLRFADASHEHREVVTVAAPRAAVIPPGTDDESRFLFPFPDGWKALHPTLAEGLIPDALDPEALLL